MPNLDFAAQNGYTVVAPLSPEIKAKYKFLKVTERNTIVYDRKDQIVAREIVIFQKPPLETETPASPIEEAAEDNSENVIDDSSADAQSGTESETESEA
jgi:hypothetical protein